MITKEKIRFKTGSKLYSLFGIIGVYSWRGSSQPALEKGDDEKL